MCKPQRIYLGKTMNETTDLPRLFSDPNRSSRPELQMSVPLPMTPEEVQARGWSEVDIVFITGDAYVDSPSFANGLLARVMEKDGFKVAILSQPDWNSVDDFRKFGRPRLAFCVSAGNMDSMINHYTANRKVRNDDAYSPGGKIGRRPDRATLSYCQRAREAFPGTPIIAGGVEASLRRIAHYDYWSDKIRRSIEMDAKADLLIYGMGERPLLTILRRLDAGETIQEIRNVRGTVYKLGRTEDLPEESETVAHLPSFEDLLEPKETIEIPKEIIDQQEIREYKYQKNREIREKSKKAKHHFVLMTQIAFENLNPYCAKTLIQEHGDEAIVVNPPDYPLSEEDMDEIYALPFTREAHPSYAEPIPAVEVVRSSVQSHRGCFGGCSFCAITAHQGKFIQSRSENAIVAEISQLAESSDGNYVVSDLNAPTANMYRLGGKNTQACKRCVRTSCLCPEICPNLKVDQTDYINLLRQTRKIANVKNVLIASGIRTDLAVFSPEFISDLAEYHTGGHLKTAPEHVDDDVLRLMNKPSIENYEYFCDMFTQASHNLGKEQYLVPYLIAGFPGCTLNSMVGVAEYLKAHDIRPEQVQDFIPAPFQLATCAYYTGIDPITEKPVYVPKGLRERRLQHALLFYYNPDYYHDVKSALKEAKREDLIGTNENSLIPPYPSKLAALRRTSRVKKYIRDAAKEAQRKEEWRAQFEDFDQASNGNRRVSRDHTGESNSGGYRRGAREFGSRYSSSREWDSINKVWRNIEAPKSSESHKNPHDNSARNRFNRFSHSKDHVSEYPQTAKNFTRRDSGDAPSFVSRSDNNSSFRRRNKAEGEDFQRDGWRRDKKERFDAEKRGNDFKDSKRSSCERSKFSRNAGEIFEDKQEFRSSRSEERKRNSFSSNPDFHKGAQKEKRYSKNRTTDNNKTGKKFSPKRRNGR